LPRRILIVDDEQDIREVAGLTLSLIEGWDVTTVQSGMEAVRVAHEMQPDAILLDVMMPDMDGPSTLRILRSRERTQDIPVIFLTAKVHATQRRQYFDLGVSEVIAKPFDPLTLGQTIRASLRW
jgi:CheY-like chemotaxis protein